LWSPTAFCPFCCIGYMSSCCFVFSEEFYFFRLRLLIGPGTLLLFISLLDAFPIFDLRAVHIFVQRSPFLCLGFACPRSISWVFQQTDNPLRRLVCLLEIFLCRIFVLYFPVSFFLSPGEPHASRLPTIPFPSSRSSQLFSPVDLLTVAFFHPRAAIVQFPAWCTLARASARELPPPFVAQMGVAP